MGISESTLSRELRRNSGGSGNYIWFKAHQKAMERRRRTTSNARLSPELVWRIKEYILEEQWSPRQIAGVLSREGIHGPIKASTTLSMLIRQACWLPTHGIS
uniref:IS30 family transposase n=2 Tax=unclassified Prevotella TaxID=2638335 RepID=A0AB33IX36_9BACT